jgi:class 3 adenylate cyclase
MSVPAETRYARSGEVSIAYQVTGAGSRDLVYVPGVSQHVELNWENPPVSRFLERLGSLGRLIVFDKRGTGMSDRVTGSPTLDARMDDIRAVMDATDSEQAVLFGAGDGGQLCLLFAATYPERTNALILFHTPPRFSRSAELPFLRSRGEQEEFYDEMGRRFGEPGFVEGIVRNTNPDASDEEVSAFARVYRLSVSPGAVVQFNQMSLDVDVSGVLPAVRVPTLILHRPDAPAVDNVRIAEYMASRIPSARIVALPGRNQMASLGDQAPLFAELERFLSLLPEGEGGEPQEAERILATVLFTDIVGATAAAAEFGDQRWRELLTAHHDRIRAELARYRGREVDTAGDGFFATFDGPARAIRCACAVTDAVRELGLGIRAGLHTGECELVDGKVGGLAVHIGARVAAEAAPGEVLVSSTVKDLVAGSEIEFIDRGTRELKGVPGAWQLYSVAR